MYKLVWNKSLQVLVVAPEGAKSNGKGSMHKSKKLAAVALASLIPSFAFSNTFLDFSGGLTGWTTVGTASVLGSTDSQTLGSTPFTITPTTGQNMIRLKPQGSSVVAAGAETALGLSNGSLTTLLGTNTTNFGYATKTQTLTAGTTYSFAWAYAASDYQPFNDGVLFSVAGNSDQQILYLARNGKSSTDTSGPQASTLVLGSYGATSWLTSSFTVATSGSYKLSFATFNWDDTAGDPIFYFASQAGATTGSNPNFVPPSPLPVIATNINNAGGMSASNLSGASPTLYPVFDGGVLRLDGTSLGGTYNFSITKNNGTIDLNQQSASIDTAISGVGGLTVSGNGTLTLSATNTYNGTTTLTGGVTNLTGSLASTSVTVAGGTLIDSNGGLAKGTNLTVNGGAVNVNADQAIAHLNGTGGGVAIASGKTLAVSGGGSYAGSISGNGALSITGGTETLSGRNLHTGGTIVGAGATLSISSGDALGTGSLKLQGSATAAATLQTTATTTIKNDLTVTGDPIFNVASGTTTTISSAISGTGDIEIAGGGTLNLTNANTYSGPTTVDIGSTLTLNGNGSIKASSAVTNKGTIDLSGATNTVALGGAYSQTSTGNLKMVAAPGVFQKLTVGGVANLNGALSLTATPGVYSIGRYTLLDATGGVNGTFSTFDSNFAAVTSLGFQIGYGTNQVYLFLTPNTTDTLQQIQDNANSLRTAINMQVAQLQTGLTYDCSTFDTHNVCIGTGGRYTFAGENSAANIGGLLILGYRPSGNTRFGAFIDQSLNNSKIGNIGQRTNHPTVGLFGNWSLNNDGNGLNIHASSVFSSSVLTISRSVSPTTEGGEGESVSHGQAYELRADYVKPVTDKLTLIPYVGLRYGRIANSAYTEEANMQTIWPVSYNAMSQESLSAVIGSNISIRLHDKLTAVANLGVLQNLDHRKGNYAGISSIPGLPSFNTQMTGENKTMATASAGASYEISKSSYLSVNALWQEHPSDHKGTTSVMGTWMIGY